MLFGEGTRCLFLVTELTEHTRQTGLKLSAFFFLDLAFALVLSALGFKEHGLSLHFEGGLHFGEFLALVLLNNLNARQFQGLANQNL